ncbi:Capsule polysaccharide biosynthesis protein [Phocoenobacter uteri]|uniref:Capsule polysaccharide biosynthesis protein n=1 Tax=Phocoenobacter uteri TaxID=146806 RepID=A0A379CAK1_9PAST|nr:capsular polysaccharide biosynthesis protein [Phocoenobacter uteri]MDG6881288.1 capsule biosynthesis protein [Phocoenobacter uteri]SUB59313.1 Capsule polysaccharide biosynthesis protein [Phocoenobacter uteri]
MCSDIKAIIFSRGIKKIPHLQHFLPEFGLSNSTTDVENSVVMGWGYRPSTKKALDFARKHNLSYIALEDGFLRSLGLGINGYPPLSMIVDDLGIYYDSSKPSRLEKLILDYNDDFELNYQAKKAMYLMQKYQLSKYNHALNFSSKISDCRPVTLIIDQTFGDMSVTYGKADEQIFLQMVKCAIAENPKNQIWVKTHPDVLSGKKKGYFCNFDDFQEKVTFIADDVNPQSLLEQAENVYCVTSQMGFEALLLGKKVVTFGTPWFAGWGLTDDRHAFIAQLRTEKRRTNKNITALFAAAYLQYSRYISPFNGKPSDIFEVIDYLKRSKIINQKLAGEIYCVGMSIWKRAAIKPFFNVPQCQLKFISIKQAVNNISLFANAKILVWGNSKNQIEELAHKHQIPVLKMEDGFIRSVGLGSNLVPPLSLVIDPIGIYFDATKRSYLEEILQNFQFSSDDLLLANKIRKQLIAQHIGKYNVGNADFEINSDKKTLLVVGQVEDDASIKFGSPEIKTNLALLQKVREQNTDCYIIYKPHPDVVSKNRNGKIARDIALQYADQLIETANILDCINQVDEVHTLTSLAGFETLLRNKKVVCYGLPFYSNWGLTKDYLPLPRRTRKLTLDELVAGVMIYYPQYIEPQHQYFIDPLQAINILKTQKEALNHNGFKRFWISKQIFKLKQLIKLVG